MPTITAHGTPRLATGTHQPVIAQCGARDDRAPGKASVFFRARNIQIMTSAAVVEKDDQVRHGEQSLGHRDAAADTRATRRRGLAGQQGVHRRGERHQRVNQRGETDADRGGQPEPAHRMVGLPGDRAGRSDDVPQPAHSPTVVVGSAPQMWHRMSVPRARVKVAHTLVDHVAAGDPVPTRG